MRRAAFVGVADFDDPIYAGILGATIPEALFAGVAIFAAPPAFVGILAATTAPVVFAGAGFTAPTSNAYQGSAMPMFLGV
jgi:hypothetical protein